MNDADRIQVWTFRQTHRADAFAGEIDYTVTERLDFDRLIVETHALGVAEGAKVDERDIRPLDATVTPEGAARYRRTHGYTRKA